MEIKNPKIAKAFPHLDSVLESAWTCHTLACEGDGADERGFGYARDCLLESVELVYEAYGLEVDALKMMHEKYAN